MAASAAVAIDYFGGAAAVESAATAVAYTGVAMSVVGAATGNKSLTKIGSVMGIAGGLTDLGTSAFAASDAGSAALSADTASNAAGSSITTPTPVDASGNPVSNDILDTGSAQAGGNYGLTGSPGSSGALTPPTDTSPSGWTSWFNALPTDSKAIVGAGMVQAGGAAVGGLFNGWTEQQKLGLAQQQQNLIANQYSNSVINANAQPTVKFTPYSAPQAPQAPSAPAPSAPSAPAPMGQTPSPSIAGAVTPAAGAGQPLMGPGLVGTVTSPTTTGAA
jgi:hypothetical protein